MYSLCQFALDIQAPWTTWKRRPCFGGIWMATVGVLTANSLGCAVGPRPPSFKAPPGAAIRSRSRSTGTLAGLLIVFGGVGQPGGAVRVLGSIDDGGLRSFWRISQDFILAPDGKFVGE